MDSDCWEWKTDLAKDIHDALKCKESSIMPLKGQSKLVYWRRYLVDWLALTCQKYKLNANAQHLAVCLYDRFTDEFDIDVGDVQMLVICCLLVASKFEEIEENIPKFKTLVQQLQWDLDSKEYLQMEIRILTGLKWQISFPTAVHFKEYYMQVAIEPRDMIAGCPVLERKEVFVYLEKNVNYFLEVSLQDHAFLVFKPSLVTSACIAAARICLRITPTWTGILEERTKYLWQHLAPCIEILLRLYDDDRFAAQKSSSSSSSSSSSLAPIGELDSSGGTPIRSPLFTMTKSSDANESIRAPTWPHNQHFTKGFLF